MGPTDFYESLSVITRINAALVQASEELHSTFKPENGQFSASLDRALINSACGLLKQLRANLDEGSML
jgi:hypothetical protein